MHDPWKVADSAGPASRHIDELAVLVGDNFSSYRRLWHLDAAQATAPRPWNWSAFFAGGFWFFYRRMIGWGLLFWLLPMLLVGLQSVLYPSLLLPWVLIVLVRVIVGVVANQLYLSRCMRLLMKINAAHAGEHRRRTELVKAGRVSYTAVVVALALTAVLRVASGFFVEGQAQDQVSVPVMDEQAPYSAGQWQYARDPDAAKQMQLRRARFVEDRERLAMTAWPAGTATDDHQCLVKVSLVRGGQVVDVQANEAFCDLDWADRTNLVNGLRKLNFRIEGSDDLFEREVTLQLPFVE